MAPWTIRKIPKVKVEVHLDMLHSQKFFGYSLLPWKLCICILNTLINHKNPLILPYKHFLPN